MIATTDDLFFGDGRQILMDWSRDPKNMIITLDEKAMYTKLFYKTHVRFEQGNLSIKVNYL